MLLFKLLAGHLNRYRRVELLRTVVEVRNQGAVTSRWMLAVLNSTLQVRRQYHLRVVVRVKQLLSRVRYMAGQRKSSRLAPAGPRTISLLCPTRGRLQNVRAFVQSVRHTAAFPERVEILFYIDDDDPLKEAYLSYFKRSERKNRFLLRCVPIVGPPIGISKAWTLLAEQSVGDLLFMANDDQVHVDYAWDETTNRICDGYADGIVCMYYEDRSHDEVPEDGIPRGNFPIVTRKWFDIVGHFTPGIFGFWCNEVWILDIAQRIGRLRSIPNVLIDHLHYDAYKSPFDETYFRPQARGDTAARDRELFVKTAVDRIKAAVKLNRAIRAAQEQQQPGPTAVSATASAARAAAVKAQLNGGNR